MLCIDFSLTNGVTWHVFRQKIFFILLKSTAECLKELFKIRVDFFGLLSFLLMLHFSHSFGSAGPHSASSASLARLCTKSVFFGPKSDGMLRFDPLVA